MIIASMARAYIIPSQHFDLIWRRPVDEYRAIRGRVISRFLDMLEEFPYFKVTLVQALALRHFLEDNPKDRERLLRFVREGRLEIALGGLSLIDLNLVCGESIVRNMLYGKQWLEQELGAKMSSANFADAFGINGQMPQIISGFGLDSMAGARMPGAAGNLHHGDYGACFWEGLDGTKVMVFFDAMGKLTIDDVGVFHGWGVLEGYDSEYERFTAGHLDIDVAEHVEGALSVLNSLPGNPIALQLSGETHLPNPAVVSALEERAVAHGLTFATQSEYVAAVRTQQLPTLRGEFNPQFTGCYSGRTRLKQLNRSVERLLLSTDMLRAIELIEGHPCSGADLRPFWERLAFVQFHDSLAGCIDDDSLAFVTNEYERLSVEARKLLDDAISGLASRCDTQGQGEVAVVIFNPAPHRKSDYVFIPDERGMAPVDDAGNPIPAQKWDGGMISRLPLRSAGASVVWLGRQTAAETEIIENPERVNFSFGGLDVDAAGTGLSIRVSGADRNLFRETPSLVLLEDTGTLWAEDYSGREGRLIPRLVSYEKGPIARRLTFRGEIDGGSWEGFGSLSAETSFLFFSDIPKIRIKVRLKWSGCNTKIMLRLPFACEGGWRALHSIPFGSVERLDYGLIYGDGKDVSDAVVFGKETDRFARGDWPVLHWVDVRCSDGWGFALVNDGTPAHRISCDGIDVGLLRSGTAHTVPVFPVRPGPLSFENGESEFDFVLIPHRGDIDLAALEAELFMPPIAVVTDCHPGSDSQQIGVIQSLPGNVSVSSVKVAEDGGRALILRLYELGGRAVEFDLKVPFPVNGIYSCNLEERTESRIDRITMRAYEIRTLRLEL